MSGTGQEKRSAVVTIRCRCVLCRHVQQIDPSKVDELGPSCEKCFGPMVVEQAEVRRGR
jgi:hypothetical protein